jgi:hypothetical protein
LNFGFHSLQFIAGGIMPILRINKNLDLRTEGYIFMPIDKLNQRADGSMYHGKTLSCPNWMSEIALVYELPFTAISVFANHYNTPKKNWNVGLNLGFLLRSPNFAH